MDKGDGRRSWERSLLYRCTPLRRRVERGWGDSCSRHRSQPVCCLIAGARMAYSAYAGEYVNSVRRFSCGPTQVETLACTYSDRLAQCCLLLSTGWNLTDADKGIDWRKHSWEYDGPATPGGYIRNGRLLLVCMNRWKAT